MLALAFFAAWLLWRSRRERLARAVAEQADAEAAAGLSLLVCGAVVLVAAFARPRSTGAWFPGRQLVAALPVAAALVAWGCATRRAPARCSARSTLAGSAWLLLALASGRRRLRATAASTRRGGRCGVLRRSCRRRRLRA